MSNLEIKKYPHPILREKCRKVEKITPEIRELIKKMIETMKKNNGMGLAAPQVGVAQRIIVVATEKEAKGFINPRILKKSKEKVVITEGCLSFPNLFLKIKRPREIEIEALDNNGRKIKVGGLLARVLQHEIDHLDGILFIDRIPFWQRFKIRKNYH